MLIVVAPFREASENVDFNFCRTKVAAKLIIISEHIRDIFSELDTSSDVVEIRVCPHSSTLKISTFGTMAHYSVEIPATSDMISHFQVMHKAFHPY
jgi:cell cycle checkpoint protein